MIITDVEQQEILHELLTDAACPLKQAISGDVYLDERPKSTAEDVVINSLPVSMSQVQMGVANVNIYVPDVKLTSKGRYVKDGARLKELTQLALLTLEEVDAETYTLWVEVQGTYAEPETKSHYSNLRIEFRHFNF